jgi:hypothetical protein
MRKGLMEAQVEAAELIVARHIQDALVARPALQQLRHKDMPEGLGPLAARQAAAEEELIHLREPEVMVLAVLAVLAEMALLIL